MLYSILKVWVRLGALIFCRRLTINNRALLKEKGPLLLACNHPNSFLDAVVLDVLFEEPIWSLARGDAFINKTAGRILHTLNMLPVYRTSEGVENLENNYKTFDACIEIFRKKGLVLIFSEGLGENEWHLRPLKKGTARLALKSWAENIPLKVLPVGMNYSSFRRFGKNISIQFGEIITRENMDWNLAEGSRIQFFNNQLQQQLSALVYKIDKSDKEKQKHLLGKKPPLLLKIFLFLPAIIGWLAHAPLYLPASYFTLKNFQHTIHYDAVLTGLLVFSYPVYLFLLTLPAFIFIKSWWVFLLILFLPFTAWCYVQVKEQLDR
jgi:1-acyl-sn-glycerol-3-phosphate acyltransferase